MRRAVEQRARVFKAHLQVGGYDPNDPLLDPVRDHLAAEGIPVVVHCGSGPAPGAHTGPGPTARLLRRHPGTRLVGVPGPAGNGRRPAARRLPRQRGPPLRPVNAPFRGPDGRIRRVRRPPPVSAPWGRRRAARSRG
ncbi:amidohydrolase family protein [Streptosporangium nondiastaticum]|uniref:amidohydrolase family protein n=1 Tax=Streptosporangium nondiastaticum TaxID=35764 RepID=UPI003F4ABDF7